MPKVKEAPKTNEKEKAQAEKLAKLKIVESAVPALVKLFTKHRDADEKAKTSLLEVVEHIRDAVVDNNFEKDQTRALLKSALAQTYCEGDESQVSMDGNATAYTLLSKLIRVAHPVDSKANKEVSKAMEKGVDFNEILKVARGDKTANEAKKKGKHGGERKKGGNAIEDEDDFGNAISAIINRAWNGEDGTVAGYEGGLDLDKMEEVISNVIGGYREKASGDEPEEEKD